MNSKYELNKLPVLVGSLMAAFFIVSASFLPVAAATPTTTFSPSLTYWTARWGVPGLGQYHRTLTDDYTYGFMFNFKGDFAVSERSYSGISISVTNVDGNQVFGGFVDTDIATVGTIQSISITGTGTYVVRLWFDSDHNGEYGTWSSMGLRTGFEADTFGEIIVPSAHYINTYTPITLRYINGVPCSMVLPNCKFTLAQMQHGKVPGITNDVAIALAISVNNNFAGTTLTAQINSVSVTTST